VPGDHRDQRLAGRDHHQPLVSARRPGPHRRRGGHAVDGRLARGPGVVAAVRRLRPVRGRRHGIPARRQQLVRRRQLGGRHLDGRHRPHPAGRRAAPAVLGGLTAVVVQVLFSLVGLSVLVVSAFMHLHPLTIALAASCLVASVAALTYEQTEALRRSRTEALTDDLTTVGNRRVLDDRLPALVADSTQGRPLLLSIVSIRHLPEINETLGYEYGDGLLAALGTRLRERLDDRTVSARLGGAEIAVLQPFDGNLAQAEQWMRDLLTAIGDPVRLPGGQVDIELSAGIAAGPVHATDSRGLLRCAADALRQAKATESEVEVYDPAQDVGRDFGPRLLPELIGALDSGLIVASYEPI